ncbi:GntR family transcriptional regulator [Rhodoferax sp. GW822-FHT02A01]|uniref:GntR family transcriptional regulator n=1 Tax=Rhodoferax sp. GW822-FHT02A01 TaxID=3141537 RepID=UPI00315C7B52
MDTSDSSPLYLQLARDLALDIREGRYSVDQALPSERVLAESLQVSRVTARKAIAVLVAQGLVVQRQGSGNFIAPYLEQPLVRLCSFTEELERRGYQPSSEWLLRKVGPANHDERQKMGLEEGARVARLHRVRLADGVRMALEQSILPVAILPQPQRLEGSLYAYLRRLGRAPVRATQHVRAIGASAEMAHHLQIPQGTPLLWASRVATETNGCVVEITQSYCRSDYYDFVSEMRV